MPDWFYLALLVIDAIFCALLWLGGRLFFQFFGLLSGSERREQMLRQTKAVEIAWLFHKAFFHEKSSAVSLIQNSFRSISPFGSAKSCCHPFAYGQILKIAVFPVTHFESRGTVDKKRIKCLFFCLPVGPNSARTASKVDKKRGKCVIFVYRLVEIQLAWSQK